LAPLGLTLSLVGGASAAVVPGAEVQTDTELHSESSGHSREEEIADVSWLPSTCSTRKALQLLRTAFSWPAVAAVAVVAAAEAAVVAVVAAAEAAAVAAVAVCGCLSWGGCRIC